MIGLLLPLLLIAPFTLYVMFPNLGKQQDMSKGELLLYENEEAFYSSLLNICCKYIMCHGIRVSIFIVSLILY